MKVFIVILTFSSCAALIYAFIWLFLMDGLEAILIKRKMKDRNLKINRKDRLALEIDVDEVLLSRDVKNAYNNWLRREYQRLQSKKLY